MSIPGSTSNSVGPVRDHTFHPLRVSGIVAETAEARSLVFEVPADLQATFEYRSGQFCSFRVVVDGVAHIRCYSMSSAPGIDGDLQVTVKRVPDGIVSNFLNDSLAVGDVLEVARPTGFFQLAPGEGDVVFFGAGSGITPIYSLLKTVLATTTRRAGLLYANHDRDAVIFAAGLETLARRHGERFTVTHHLDVEAGFAQPATIAPLCRTDGDAEFYVCGPGPFMALVEQTLLDQGVDEGRIHIERFTASEPASTADTGPEQVDGIQVTIDLDGRSEATTHRAGTTILQTARQMGMAPPFSCEAGSCATCMARVVDGAASMLVNNALTTEEVEAGWVLTCQAVPVTPTVHVIYGFD